MAFVNLPPNLKDIFYSLSDRIAKLETGPNQALYYAESAQGTGTQALVEATAAFAAAEIALDEAEAAIAEAEIAIATANSASIQATQATYEAGVAQTTANGKNKVTYSTAAASGTAQNGDIWFQVNGTGQVLNQYVYNASAWQTAPITNSVIANLDAGKITAGTITGIAYNNGSGTFSVTPGGALVASSAIITGQITATSGTFTGTVYATAGTFTGTITSTSGTIGGFFISTSYIGNSDASFYISSSTGNARFNILYINASSGTTGISMLNGGNISMGGGNISMGAGNITGSGTLTAANLTATSAISSSGTITSTTDMTSNGELRAVFGANNTVTNAASTWMSTTGQLRRVSSSSMRYKENVIDLVDVEELHPRKLLNLPVRAFTYKEEYLASSDDRYQQMFPGFISEEVDAIYPMAADYENGDVESWNDRILVPAMLALIQDQEARIAKLEGTNG
jgi:hypothetical protein